MPVAPSASTPDSATGEPPVLKSIMNADVQIYGNKPSLFSAKTFIETIMAWATGKGDAIWRPKEGDAVEFIREDRPTFLKPHAEIRIDLGEDEYVNGWMLMSSLGDYMGPKMEPVDDMALATSAIVSAEASDSNASMLLSLAIILSGLKNDSEREGENKRYGPFRFTESEWAAHVKAAPESGVTRYEIGDTGAQFIIAGGILGKIVDQMVASTGLGKMPTYAQVYLGQILGAEIATHLIKASATGDARIDAALNSHLVAKGADGSKAAEQIKAMLALDADAFTSNGAAKTIKEIETALGGRLDDAATKANDLLNKYYAMYPGLDPLGTETPWRLFAYTELTEAEDRPDQTPTDEEKSEHIKAVGGAMPIDGSLSAAFVAWCLAEVSEPKIKLPENPAIVNSWLKWGDAIDGPIPGAIAVVNSPTDPTVQLVGVVRRKLENSANFKLIAIDADGKLKRLEIAPNAQVAMRFPSEAGSGGKLPKAAEDLIIAQEVSSEKRYRQYYGKRAVFPGGSSGATIGIGYDVGQGSLGKLRADWKGRISDDMLAALETFVGLKGNAAKARRRDLDDKIDIPWEVAYQVFNERTVPEYTKAAKRRLPNTEKIGATAFGALLSLTFNRGASFKKSGARYTEMRNIRRHMMNGDYIKIPDEFISMQRLWKHDPKLKGVVKRRVAEAKLFEQGLKDKGIFT